MEGHVTSIMLFSYIQLLLITLHAEYRHQQTGQIKGLLL